jgi:flagellar hook protein FlgE
MSTISTTGLVAAQKQLQTISSNVANANTDGFKLQTAKFASLVAADGRVAPGLGVRSLNDVTDFSQGSLRSTGRDLDLAMSGRGFFVTLPKSATTGAQSGALPGSAVDTSIRLTRNGSFKIDKDGYVVDLNGRKLAVQGTTAGNVEPARVEFSKTVGTPPATRTLGYSRIELRDDGELFAIYDDNSFQSIGKVAIGDVRDPTNLRPENSTQFSYIGSAEVPSIATSGERGRGTVLSGLLEGSNVNLTDQLVEMITAQRNYQANAKGISATDTMAQTLINLR